MFNQRNVPAKRKGREYIQRDSREDGESDISTSFPATDAPEGQVDIRPCCQVEVQPTPRRRRRYFFFCGI